MANITTSGPQYAAGGSLRQWAVEDRLPWLVERLGLTAGAICGSLDEDVRRKVYGLEHDGAMPAPIDWGRNGIVISPPGTGKGMAIFVEALAHFERVLVLVPSVIQAHKLEESIDVLYNEDVGGCKTSQRKSPGLISVITTGILHQMVKDNTSDLWKEGTVLIVDEAQRILEQDPLTEFMVGVAAQRGVRTMIVSATVAPGTLPQVYGHAGSPALVYDLEKQMHPVEIKSLDAKPGEEIEALAKHAALNEPGMTSLVFIASRRGVMKTTKAIRRLREKGEVLARVVPVTGNHMVEDQLEQVRLAQASGDPVVVVATPGTMDSSVTIPGLSLVVIFDRRVRVDWNQYGVRERWSERLPINHIWQMIRRVGRQKRDDGKLDQVLIVGGARADILAEKPAFTPIEGCSPWTSLEDLLLSAVLLNIPFGDVHEYMVSSFAEERVRSCVEEMLTAGLVARVDDPSDPDGLELTEKGELVARLPYSYGWARVIAEASKAMWPQLALLASFGYLDDLEMFEIEDGDVEEDKTSSEMLAKLALGIEYLGLAHDHRQHAMAVELGISFRRLEQVETLFELGCRALEVPFSPPTAPSGVAERELLAHVVTAGLGAGLWRVYFPAKDGKGWSDPRVTDDGKMRRHLFPDERLTLGAHADDGMACVVGVPTWFTSARGGPMANVNDVTIVPKELVPELVARVAEVEGWFQLMFAEGEHRGKIQYSAVMGGTRYVVSRYDAPVQPGRRYWVSVDTQIASGVTAVVVHYPVLQ